MFVGQFIMVQYEQKFKYYRFESCYKVGKSLHIFITNLEQ